MNLLKSVANWFSQGKHNQEKYKYNQINVIKPYVYEGIWVFDDEEKGLYHEALIAGMPELIMAGCQMAGIKNPEKGFTAVFSKDPFPGYKICLDWVREESGGNVYVWKTVGKEGWLCPALFRYFSEAPKKMYIDLMPQLCCQDRAV